MIESLGNKEYRDALVAAYVRRGLAMQIRAMQEGRGWTQAELGQRADMAQATISLLENPDYGRYTLQTLRRLASAFDVALVVRFAPFSELVDYSVNLSPEDLDVPPFEHDEGLLAGEAVADASNIVDFTAVGMTSVPSTHWGLAARCQDTSAGIREQVPSAPTYPAQWGSNTALLA